MADNYFSRVSKRQTLERIYEARGQPAAPAWEKLKKPELAKEAERQVDTPLFSERNGDVC